MTGPLDTRRALRLAAHCTVRVGFGAGAWQAETEDVGATGCRFVAKLPLRRGEAVRLRLQFEGVPFALEVAGSVAWCARKAPWRTGVAFARGQEQVVERFVRAVAVAAPALALQAVAARRPARAPVVPDRTVAERRAQARALLEVARADRAVGRNAEAREWLKAALKLTPDDAEIAQELGGLELPVAAGG